MGVFWSLQTPMKNTLPHLQPIALEPLEPREVLCPPLRPGDLFIMDNLAPQKAIPPCASSKKPGPESSSCGYRFVDLL
jgi:hypothetical protein